MSWLSKEETCLVTDFWFVAVSPPKTASLPVVTKKVREVSYEMAVNHKTKVEVFFHQGAGSDQRMEGETDGDAEEEGRGGGEREEQAEGPGRPGEPGDVRLSLGNVWEFRSYLTGTRPTASSWRS